MKPSQALTYLKSCMAYNAELGAKAMRGERVSVHDYQRPALIGGVGVAKSALAFQASAAMGFQCWQYMAANSEPSDLGGMPYDDGDAVKFRRVAMLPKKGEKKNIFFDEVGQCDRHQFNPIANLTNDREINSHPISEFATVICAWNPVTARAGSVRIGNNFLTRVTQITVTVDVGDWLEYARSQNLDEGVIAYIAARGASVLEDFDPARDINANPRTWFAVGRARELGLTKALEMEVISGSVGNKHMADFYAFIGQRHSLPNAANIFKNPLGVPLPQSSSALYSLVSTLVAGATYDTFKAGLEYISRTNSTEFVMFYLNGLAQRDKKEASNPHRDRPFSSHPEYNRIILAINSQPTV